MLKSLVEFVLLITVLAVGGIILEVPYVNEDAMVLADFAVSTVVAHIDTLLGAL